MQNELDINWVLALGPGADDEDVYEEEDIYDEDEDFDDDDDFEDDDFEDDDLDDDDLETVRQSLSYERDRIYRLCCSSLSVTRFCTRGSGSLSRNAAGEN